MVRKYLCVAMCAIALGYMSCNKDDNASDNHNSSSNADNGGNGSGADNDKPVVTIPDLSNIEVAKLTPEQIVAIIPQIKENQVLQLDENFSGNIQEAVSMITEALVLNPEQAKHVTLDLSRANIKKIDASFFDVEPKTSSLQKAGLSQMIQLYQMILPATVQEIASGACVMFEGTNFWITSADNLTIGAGAFSDNGVSFSVNPDFYFNFESEIAKLKVFGEVTCDWEIYLRSGKILSNKGLSIFNSKTISVPFDSYYFDFAKDSSYVSIWQLCNTDDGKLQQRWHDMVSYTVENNKQDNSA
ncbi:MAG: hypothetical protein MJZ61_10235, partial [Bacteroidales bacterium]|nr:hypothetical protein [Bacteroidales bacterium]